MQIKQTKKYLLTFKKIKKLKNFKSRSIKINMEIKVGKYMNQNECKCRYVSMALKPKT